MNASFTAFNLEGYRFVQREEIRFEGTVLDRIGTEGIPISVNGVVLKHIREDQTFPVDPTIKAVGVVPSVRSLFEIAVIQVTAKVIKSHVKCCSAVYIGQDAVELRIGHSELLTHKNEGSFFRIFDGACIFPEFQIVDRISGMRFEETLEETKVLRVFTF